ncbi:MAG TPA: energy transducer TonB [Lysobacter sp.]
MARRAEWVLLLVLLLGAAQARAPEEVRKQIEVSMLVTGSVDIERDGSVGGHSLDKVEALPKVVVDLIGAAVTGWQFEPVSADGHAVAARSRFSLRVVGNQAGNGDYTLRIAAIHFGKAGEDASIPRKHGPLAPPRYPEQAARSGVGGTVYLVLRIGRDGSVEDVIAKQVNLRATGTAPQMTRFRKQLADISITTARRWRFDPPVQGDDVNASPWSVQVPVDFYAPDRSPPSYGQWEAYVPGPRAAVPWRTSTQEARDPADAIAAGGVYSDAGDGPRLLTPPAG